MAKNQTKPLAPEELEEMIGYPVWIVTDSRQEWCLVHSYHPPEVCGRCFIMTNRAAVKRQFPFADYGLTWLAYRNKPTESER